MYWSAVSAIAEIIGVVFVAVSVVYLALQVKSGAQATHSQTYYLATSALAELSVIIGSDRELMRIFRAGLADPHGLTEDELGQFNYLLLSLFRRYENIFFQYESGMVDDDFWVGHRENILWFFHRAGTQALWRDRKLAFSARFQRFLDGSTPADIASPASRRY